MAAGRESLARCTVCSWAGVYAVQPAAAGALARIARERVNPCPRCTDGDVRCAVTVQEEHEAIRQYLAAGLRGVDVLPTSDGRLAVVLQTGQGVPCAATIDPALLEQHPRAALDTAIASLRAQAAALPPRSPYR